ncbi:probable ATP-dependent RNA helicase DDX28 [Spea bombifrons]|uniref:probable ATP-dependent RNA helicase DDX28 n=1 Tax=Spea bombifrons TaxID=233779 RepID=UPI00234A6345|nr:probable ATP-dependent RNA helicase DDX28 [Spea bombifrons]
MLSIGSVLLRARVPSAFLRRATSSVAVPVIRVPRRSQLLAEKRSRESNAGPVVTPRAGKLLISARRRELNQPAGETCGQWVYPALVSKGWKHRLSRGDYFTIERQNEQCPGPNAQCTFQSMALDKEVIAALSLLGIKYPTWVQTQAIPVMMSGKNILCAAETGSGKTLGYLLPIIQQLLTHKTTSESQDPCNLILVPSRELANQVSSVATNLCAQLGLTVSTVGGGRGLGAVDRQLSRGPVDILVATPGALWKALNRDTVSLASLRCVVLDEVDTLFDNTFSEVVENILMQTLLASESEVQGPERKPQLVAVGATFPRGVLQALGKMIDLGKISTIKSKRLHFLMPHVQHTFMKLKGEDKVPELLNILKKQAVEGQGSGVLVFCNSSSTVNWLGYILDDHLIKHSRLQGLMPAAMRSGIFQSFQKGDSGVLICTDLASRGLDSLNVKVVVNYDFPATLQDYLHRAGRVGRLGSERQGSVVSFVTHLWDVELVQKIETAARKRSSLFGMKSAVNDSTIKDPIRKEN